MDDDTLVFTDGLTLFNKFRELRRANLEVSKMRKIRLENNKRKKQHNSNRQANAGDTEEPAYWSDENDQENEETAEDLMNQQKKRKKKGDKSREYLQDCVEVDIRDLSSFKSMMDDILHTPLPLCSFDKKRLFASVYEFLLIQGIKDYQCPGCPVMTIFIALVSAYPKLYDENNKGYLKYFKDFLQWCTNGRRGLRRRGIVNDEDLPDGPIIQLPSGL